MGAVVLVDSSPLVAYLSRREQFHRWCVDQLKQLEPPLLTCEAVITEASYLAGRHGAGAEAVLDLIRQGVVKVSFSLSDELESIHRLISKYVDLPMSLADACLVRMAELNPAATVLTLDRHFNIYRKNNRQVVPTLMPQ
jgi:predicted nucleic acid-binding protein